MSSGRAGRQVNERIHHQAEELAAALPPLLVAAERVASTVSQGVHGRRRVGQGETFWQFRRYQYGDSASQIDWRQSAKSQPVYVRENEWEAAQTVWVWRDGSASMHFTSGVDFPTKSERADLLLLALVSLLIRGGERAALLGTGMSPGSGRHTQTRMWSLIENAGGDMPGLPEFELLPRHGRVVWFGDFLSSLDDISAAITPYANRGIRGHLVQVLDPAEERLPYQGRILFRAMEAGDDDVLVPNVDSLRSDYRQALANHRHGIESLARSVGWTFTTHRSDHPPEMLLLALYLTLSESEEGRGNMSSPGGR